MIAKLFEIRDAGMTISALAIQLTTADIPAQDDGREACRWLLERGGFGSTTIEQSQYVILLSLNGERGTWSCDPYAGWGRARTMPVAQEYLIEHFAELDNGAIIDVQYILGETKEPKTSDRFYSRKEA